MVDALAESPNATPSATTSGGSRPRCSWTWRQGSFLFGLFVVAGALARGRGRRATAIRRVSAYALREHPGLVRAGLGAAILLLVIWGPVPWTQRFWRILIFTVLAFAWLEFIRRLHAGGVPRPAAARRPSLHLPGRGAAARASSSGSPTCASAAC